MAIFIWATVLLSAAWVISGYLPTRNIPTPAYQLLEKKPEYEVRQYQSYIIAETALSPTRDGAENGAKSGFMTLFGYISGENLGGAKVDMTAPVLKSPDQKEFKIPMSAPVLKDGGTGSGSIAFVMPPGSRLEQLPRPKSTRVKLRTIEPRKVAVVTFSGVATADKIARQTAKLLEAIERDGRQAKGAPQLALYNPPWTPPFMRRNEVLVEIE